MTFLNGLPGIGRQLCIKMWFWHFSTHKIYVTVRGKFSEPHFVALFFSNPGEKVWKARKTLSHMDSWTQDLRVKHRQEGMSVGPSSKSLWKQRCLPPGSSCQKRHAFFTSQVDTVKLELENYSLSGAFLKTLPHIFILIHFLLNYTEHFLGALASTTIGLRLPTLKKTSSCPPSVKIWLI